MINNYSTESILEALRNGADADEIASSIASMLNSANKTYKAEVEEAKKKAEEEAKRKVEEEAQKKAEEKRHTEMIIDLAQIITELLDFFTYYYDEEIPEDVDETKLAEEALNTYETLSKFGNLFRNFDFHSLISTSDGKTTKTVKNDNGKVTMDKKPVKQTTEACPKKVKTVDLMSETNQIIDDFLRELGL